MSLPGGAGRRLVVVGELNPDIVVTGVPDLADTRGSDQVEDLVASTTLTLGSSAAITASAAARAGADSSLVAVVGEDVLGRLCLDWATELGIDVSGVRVDPTASTGSTVILVSGEQTTRRRMLTHLGAMAGLRLEDVDLSLFADVRHLHVSSFFLHMGARERLPVVFSAARAGGIVTSLDTNDDPADHWDSGAQAMLAATDVLFCNEREARGLAGASGSDLMDVGRELCSRMPVGDDPRFPAVVLKLGGEGATALTPSGDVRVTAAAVEVVDTVGAGDTLAGTVLAALMAGSGWAEALPLGVAAATISTTGPGGTSVRPEPAEVAASAHALRVQDGPPVGT